MKRVSLDNMLSGKESRYALVLGVAKRAREISDQMAEEAALNKETPPSCEKPVLLAIEDFKNHKYNILEPEDE